MTKNAMIETIKKAEREAWERKEQNAYLLCPRISIKAMFEWLENDPHHRELCYAWSALDDILEALGIESDHGDTFEKYTHKLYVECKQAETV